MKKILILDDDRDILDGLSDIVKECEHAVEPILATNIKEAGAHITEAHAVISDGNLPDGIGLEFLETVGKKHPHVLRCFQSGNLDLVEEALKKGLDLVLYKGSLDIMGNIAKIEKFVAIAAVPDEFKTSDGEQFMISRYITEKIHQAAAEVVKEFPYIRGELDIRIEFDYETPINWVFNRKDGFRKTRSMEKNLGSLSSK